MYRRVKRARLNSVVRKLIKYDVVSFDIFDTLVFRPFANPTDLFELLGSTHNYVNFRALRQKAERDIRDETLAVEGHRETTIDKIYQKLSEYTAIDAQAGAKLEFQAELNFCYANPYMKSIFDALIQNGKRVILVSNMYYPAKMLEQLLESCGYTGYEKLFASCDHNLNKRNGELFKYINYSYFEKDSIGADFSVIHIGDNTEADIKGAEAAGWDSHAYGICSNPNKDFQGLSYLVGSCHKAVVQNFLNNGYSTIEVPHRDTVMWRLGFMYAGPMILGYLNFINNYCKTNDVDKIFFLARDGYFLQEIYDQLYPGIASEYVYWSRSAMLSNMPEYYMDECFNHYFRRRFNANEKQANIDDALSWLSLETLKAAWLKEYPEQELITTENVLEFQRFFIKHKDVFVAGCNGRGDRLEAYFKDLAVNAAHILIVDVGWRGTGAVSLRKLLCEVFKLDCKVSGCVFGNITDGNDFDSGLTTHDLLSAYAFSELTNKGEGDFFRAYRAALTPVAEIFLASAPAPSFLSYLDNGESLELSFDAPEIENYARIREIHSGARDFIEEYVCRVGSDPSLLKINGYDAFTLFKLLMKDPMLESGIGSFVHGQFMTKDEADEIRFSRLSEFWDQQAYLAKLEDKS